MKVDPKAILLEDVVGEISASSCVMTVVTESKSGAKEGKVVRLRGKFAEADTPTKNKRVYGRKLWESNITRLKDSMAAKRVKGEVDHPHDGKTRLSRCALYVTDLEIRENGEIWGEMELFPDKPGTPAAQLHSIIESGGTVGVSSRGFGLTETDAKGNTIVKEGTYRLDAFDVVEDPAVGDAFPRVYYEDVAGQEDARGEEMSITTVEELKSAHPDLVKAIAEEASRAALDGGKKALAQEVAESVERKMGAIREEMRREMLADPNVALSKSIVEEIAAKLRPLVGASSADAGLVNEVTELRVKVPRLEKSLTEAQDKIRHAQVGAYLRTELAYDPCGDAIASMLGEAVLEMELSEVEAKVASLRAAMKAQGMKPGKLTMEDMDRIGAEATKRIGDLQAALAEATSKLAPLTEEVSTLKSRLEETKRQASSVKAASVEETTMAEVYKVRLEEEEERAERLEFALEVERLIASRPDRAEIRGRLLECSDIDDAADLLRNMREPRRSWRGVPIAKVREAAAKGRGREVMDESELGDLRDVVVESKDQTKGVGSVLDQDLGSVGLTVRDILPSDGQ